jgi:hypothetical protein
MGNGGGFPTTEIDGFGTSIKKAKGSRASVMLVPLLLDIVKKYVS